MPRREGQRIDNRARRKRKEQRLRSKGYDIWTPKRAKRKDTDEVHRPGPRSDAVAEPRPTAPLKVEQWKKNLEQGRLTLEMRDVFAGIGWLSSQRDSRLKDEPVDVEPAEPEQRVDKPKPSKPTDGSTAPAAETSIT